MVVTIDIVGSRPTETPAAVAKFMEENKYSFTVLLDTNQDVTRSYSIKSTPTNLLIDRDGIIREIRVGSYPGKSALEEILTKLLAG